MDRQREVDDLELDLPAPDGDLGSEEELPAASSQDLDLDMLEDEGDAEMDDATGLDEPLDVLNLIEFEDEEEGREQGSWAADSEPADDLAGAEDELIDGEEDGWTKDNEPAEDESWDGIEDLLPLPTVEGAEDGGEEGLEDDSLDPQPSDDAAGLPPLSIADVDDDESRESEELVAFGVTLLDQISAGQLTEEERVRVGPGVTWEKIPDTRVTLERLEGVRVSLAAGRDVAQGLEDGGAENGGAENGGAGPRAVPVLACSDAGAVALGSQLLSVERDKVVELPAQGLSHAPNMSVAIDPNNGRNIAVGAPDGILVSTDGGITFAPSVPPGGPDGSGHQSHRLQAGGKEHTTSQPQARAQRGFGVAFSSCEEASRLWALRPDGGLYHSDDLGQCWTAASGVASATHLTSDGRLGLAVLASEDDDSASVVRSADAGRCWSALEVPNSVRPWVTDVAVCGKVVLLGHSGKQLAVLWAGHDSLWSPVTPLARPPAVLVEEDEEVSAYVCVPIEGKVLIARRPLGRVNRPPVVVLQLAEMPLCLGAVHKDDITTLHFIVSGDWCRAWVQLDG